MAENQNAALIRRAYEDALGSLPTPEETLAFLNSQEPNKRAKLVDRLLGFETGGPPNNYNDLYAEVDVGYPRRQR